MQQIDKPAYNEEYRVCDFSPVLTGTDTVISATIELVDKTGVDMSLTMLEEVAVSTDSKGVRYKLKGGAALNKYYMGIKVTTQSNQKFEESFTICIT